MSAVSPIATAKATTPGTATARRTLVGFVATRRVVEVVLTVVLGAAGGLLLFGSNFGLNMVHSQLAAQDIAFPAAGTPALDPTKYPGLQQYGAQSVDSGPKAKAYANEYIDKHLTAVADGKTYAQVSALSQQNPNDAALTAQANTLFKGETLRGLLLYAWGWSVVSTIALYAGIAALIAFLVMLVVTAGDFLADSRFAARRNTAA